MEKINAVIIEDEFVIAEDIRQQLEEHGYEVVASFERAELALPFLIKTKPDILLIDIQLLGSMDGVDLVRQLQSKTQFPFVYITANSDKTTYDRAKQTRPNAFLIKPFSHANLMAAIDLAIYNFSSGSSPSRIEQAQSLSTVEQLLVNECLFVRTNGRYKKIYCDNILFAEAAGSYVHIQTTDQRYTLSQNLTQFQKKTPLDSLVRIHRSFTVNISKVDSFEDSFVFIQNHKIPMSENHRSEFLARIHCL